MTYLVLAAAILIVHAADVIYSGWAIGKYGMFEVNPVWRSLWRVLFHDWELFFLASLLIQMLALVGLYYIHCPAWALGFGLAARVFVLIRNVNIVRAARRKPSPRTHPANSRFVDSTNGDDSNPGTKDAPWKTMSRVNREPFLPGDYVFVNKGVYFE